ncbi:MAG: alkene reductase, partial [Dechloromonas agitata]|nr:alkene reductase [Dechloromonas agitata]
MSEALLTPCRLGDIELRNRIVMAPLTRCRADNPESAPTALMATYYAQRAAAGLIVSEGTIVSPRARGYRNSPGIWSTAQVDGWRQVTDAVHAAGGRIVCQLWHCGRISHPALTGGELPVAPSAINPQWRVQLADGPATTVTPHALSRSEIRDIVGQFGQAAANAM